MILRSLAVAVMLGSGVAAAWTQARAGAQPPLLQTNADEITALANDADFAIEDPLAVFGFVFSQLPDRVQVYPTENYFYFRFVHRGVAYAGNIRLAAADRDNGKLDFAYNERPTDWNSDPNVRHAALGPAQGVVLERVEPLVYRVSFAGRSVTFALNDLSKVSPPSGFLNADERFLGPVFDESGIRFFFVFNTRLKIFHFFLDETVPVADELVPLKDTPNIRIGKRTGFAFYDFNGRNILVGVDRRQSRLNTYFDGPFDQLPENFLQGDALRDAILAADPSVRVQIDRLGNFLDGSGRFLINPYMLYRDVSELGVFHRCMTLKTVPTGEKPRCFIIDDDQADRAHPVPQAMRRR